MSVLTVPSLDVRLDIVVWTCDLSRIRSRQSAGHQRWPSSRRWQLPSVACEIVVSARPSSWRAVSSASRQSWLSIPGRQVHRVQHRGLLVHDKQAIAMHAFHRAVYPVKHWESGLLWKKGGSQGGGRHKPQKKGVLGMLGKEVSRRKVLIKTEELIKSFLWLTLCESIWRSLWHYENNLNTKKLSKWTCWMPSNS